MRSRKGTSSDRVVAWRMRLPAFIVAAVLVPLIAVVPPTRAATPVAQRVDLRVLVFDDDSAWVDGIAGQLAAEGVPYTALPVTLAGRAPITSATLASGDHAFYQSVIWPDATGGGYLTADEVTAVRAFEAKFGVREVDAYQWANPSVGLNYSGFTGDLAGTSATVTDAGKANGFGYLNGPVPYSTGSYTFLGEPLTATSTPPMPPGASFTTMVSGVAPSSAPAATGSVVGVYSSAGVEQMVIASAFNFFLPQFKLLAHGIVTWATRGVHLGYNRNYMTFHVDDAFNTTALWDATHHCTPGEDCPRDANGVSIYPEQTTRMTPDDVNYAVQWEAAFDYKLTLAFNGFYADLANDPLTQALVAQKDHFSWLNHGSEHIYQGCIQDFTVVPWRCQTDPLTGAVLWVSQPDIYNEIQNNINTANALGLPFNATEYLSGEHSGLAQLPQQPQDNPNFAAALNQAGILSITTDASREPGQRQVGSALTVPRHPTAIFYNADTAAREVSEYNWFYTTRANGGSGYCEDNPTIATCVAPLSSPSGFASYIVPTDAAYDLSFILSNDPRPFYAHTSNLSNERVLYPLLETILTTYRAGFATSAPVVNQTQTDAVHTLQRQTGWTAHGMTTNPAASGYVQDGKVTITTDGSTAVPLTVPQGTTVAGVTLEGYGGELSGWLPASTTATLPASTLTIAGSTALTIGQPNTITITANGTPAPAIGETGTLPAGVTFTPGTGSATISGTPAVGSGGSYPITITSTSGSGRQQELLTLTVQGPPAITSAAAATALVGSPLTFTVTTTGWPAATLSTTGNLPTGITFTANPDGSGTLAGTPGSGTAGNYPLTITATNSLGTAIQAFTLTVNQPPAFTSAATASATAATPFSFTVTTTGSPTATVSMTGTLPAGIIYTASNDGTATLAGTPAGPAGNYPLTFTASNAAGTVSQAFTLVIAAAPEAPMITSATTATAFVGRAFSFTVTATGSPAATVTSSGTLPPGITFTPNANGTATLAGTPTGAASVRPLTFTASNTLGTATQSFTLTVTTPAPRITSANAATAVVGTPFSFTVSSTGNPLPTISRTGTLPAGITFTANADGTGTLAGTAAAGTGANYAQTFRAQNTAGTATQAFTLTVNQPPAFTTAATANADVGVAFTFTIRTTGFPRAALTASGALPAGVTFTPNTNGTATLSGTPTGNPGPYPVTLTATNTLGAATQAFTLTVRQRPAITSASSATATVGTPFSFTVTATGTPTPTVSRTGTLPAGITFTANSDGTGTLAGTPAAGSGRSYSLTFRAQNATTNATQAFTLTVNEPPAFTSAATANSTSGTAFTFTVRTTGFPRGGLSVTGALPPGVTFTPGTNGTATLSGTPSGSGQVYPLTFTATNSSGSASQTFALTVRDAPTITSPATATATVAQAFSFVITTTGTPTPTVTRSGTLPPGVTFTASSGSARVAGTPTRAGTYTLTITARNNIGTTTQSLTITVT